MERLTMTNNGDVYPANVGISCSNYCSKCEKTDCDFIRACLYQLATYEDTGLTPEEINGLCEMDKRARMAKMLRWEEAEADGRLVVLPCKVGDTVYKFCGTFGAVLPYFAKSLNIAYLDENRVVYQYEANATNIEEAELLDSIDFELEDIGKTVFLTREAAEAAIKESEKN